MTAVGCQGCRSGAKDFDLAMAFQPIVDVTTGRPFAYEALVRGAGGEGAAAVLSRVTPENRYAFDQQCRVAAIEQAVEAGILRGGHVLRAARHGLRAGRRRNGGDRREQRRRQQAIAYGNLHSSLLNSNNRARNATRKTY